MDIIEFMENCGNEQACRQKFKETRDRTGVRCKRCGSVGHYWLNGKQMYQCKSCRFRTSLRSGTIMEASKLPFRYWFVAIWLMGCSKKGTSAATFRGSSSTSTTSPFGRWCTRYALPWASGTTATCWGAEAAGGHGVCRDRTGTVTQKAPAFQEVQVLQDGRMR